ncbi:MAG: FadR family transcriptional regulator [Clostridia bacterium]|nr:FadR family transcriptional regulator [Clostridia bacterium]
MDISNEKKDSGGRYYEYVIDSIKEMISSGELKCGEKIPSERDLAVKFNVSRVPIREALKILEYMGILDSSRGDGTYVRNITVEDMIGKMDFALTATADTIMDLQEMRINLETFAAYNAALRRTDEDIDEIYQALSDMREAKKEPNMEDESVQNLRYLSHQFHRLLIKAAHNSVLASIYENLFELLDISRQFTINTSGISYNSILAHEAVFNKIIQQDADGARDSMADHLSDVRIKLSATLAEAEAQELLAQSTLPS